MRGNFHFLNLFDHFHDLIDFIAGIFFVFHDNFTKLLIDQKFLDIFAKSLQAFLTQVYDHANFVL